MEKVGVSALRDNLSMFLDKVKKGEEILITSRGRDLAKIVPIESHMEKSREKLREIGKTAYIGDILSPIDEEWESMN